MIGITKITVCKVKTERKPCWYILRISVTNHWCRSFCEKNAYAKMTKSLMNLPVSSLWGSFHHFLQTIFEFDSILKLIAWFESYFKFNKFSRKLNWTMYFLKITDEETKNFKSALKCFQQKMKVCIYPFVAKPRIFYRTGGYREYTTLVALLFFS